MKKKIIILSISSFFILFIIVLVLSVLMVFNFFEANITNKSVQNNYEYAEEYRMILNKHLKDGYVPLARILYFYLENGSISIEELYKLNVDTTTKTLREIEDVCMDDLVKDMTACDKEYIEEHQDILQVANQYFNFPLTSNYTVTSFFHEERIVLNGSDIHNGWDFAAPPQTPIYSVCDGEVYSIVETQEENIDYTKSGNGTGNSITLKCDKDYNELFYIKFEHIYPHSFKVKVGDKISHYTEIAGVGTTGYSDGNHCHFQLMDANFQDLDPMELVDLKLNNNYILKPFNTNNFG